MPDREPRETDDFDEFASDYGETLDTSLAITGAGRDYFAMNRVACVRRLEADARSTPSRLLDLGCGDGRTDEYLADAFPGVRITGIDVSAESVRVAAGRGIEGAAFAPYDGLHVPAGDAAFDVVFIAGVLHHVPEDADRAALLADVHRVLEPGGRLYVFEQNPRNPATRRIVDRCPFDRNARLLRAEETRRLLEQAGFEDVAVDFILFAPRHPVFKPVHSIEPALARVPFGAQYLAAARRP